MEKIFIPVIAIVASLPCQVIAASRHSHNSPSSSVHVINSSYAPGSNHTMQVYTSPSNSGRAIIVVHGGSWTFGSPKDANTVTFSTRAAEEGYKVFSIQYSLYNKTTGENTFPSQEHDVRTAIKEIKKNASSYGIDPHNLEIAGFSAGAQLAMLAGKLVKGIADFSGPTDLPKLTGGLKTVVNNLSDGPSRLAKSQSPIHKVSPLTPPTFIAQGSQDTLINPKIQVYPYAHKLRINGIPYKVRHYVGGHALSSTSSKVENNIINSALTFLNNY